MRFYNQVETPWTIIVEETADYIIFYDGFPVTNGHMLFVPMTDDAEDIATCLAQAYITGEYMVENGECEGFNVGMNNGKAAGQTIDWPHIHLIPRNTGDMENPTGGVRHVIPEKGNYHTGVWELDKESGKHEFKEPKQ